MSENGHLDRRYRVKLLALFISLLIVVAAIIVGRQGRTVSDPENDVSSESIERTGNLYIGIPARIEFPTTAAETARLARTGTASAAAGVPIPDQAKLEKAWSILADVGDTFNAFDPFSELGRLNNNEKTELIDISDDLASVIGLSTTVSQMTQGAFDSTVKPLKTLWEKAEDTGTPPEESEISDALSKMGWGYVKLMRTDADSWQVARTRPGMQIDLGGIVKGWSIDRALDYLTDHATTSALVQVGGEIGLVGKSPAGKPWRIGIRHPLQKDSNWTVLELAGRAAVSTSGNYEQAVKVGDRDYYHIFDPRTGNPVADHVLGTTVVVTGRDNPNAVADGLATAFTVMGPDETFALLPDLPGIEALFIVRDSSSGQLSERVSPGFDRFRP